MSGLCNNILFSQNNIVTNEWKQTIFIKKNYCVRKFKFINYFLSTSHMKDKFIITYQGRG